MTMRMLNFLMMAALAMPTFCQVSGAFPSWLFASASRRSM